VAEPGNCITLKTLHSEVQLLSLTLHVHYKCPYPNYPHSTCNSILSPCRMKTPRVYTITKRPKCSRPLRHPSTIRRCTITIH
jgi:hypothetical protein